MNYFENSILLKAQLSKLNFLDMWICFKKWILLIKWIFSLQYLPGKSEAIFSRSSSTSGTDSSIRIRKAREGCTERRWFISVSLALIFTVLVASAGIYFGCKLNFLKLDFWKLKKESVIIFAADFYFVELIFPLHKSIYFFA